VSHIIREANNADVTALAELRYEFRSALAQPIEERSAFLDRCRTWMTERIGNGRWFCWVTEVAGRVVGCVWVQIIDKIPTPTDEAEEHAYLTSFFVTERMRGIGIGSEMMVRVLDWTARRGVQAVFLWPTMRTRALYQRHGFHADGDVMQRLFSPRAQ
jgi:GNAT superfamily N-acetyltransferase